MPCRTREEQRRYQREWKARRRDDWLAANGPCIDCGSAENLEVDHIDPATKVDHKVWSWAEDRRLAELAKCAVRCHACHARKTALTAPRGTQNGAAKLRPEEVAAIRASSLPVRQLARQLGVGKSTIHRVRTNQNWKAEGGV